MAEETKKKEQHAEKPLEKYTVKELREIAMTIPHTTAVHDMKKEELITFISEARGIKAEKVIKQKKKTVKLKLSKAELKSRIRELKVLKLQAIEDRDGKMAKLLRLRISHLKKRSRIATGA